MPTGSRVYPRTWPAHGTRASERTPRVQGAGPARVAGQALVFVALVLGMLVTLVMTCVEVGARYQQRAEVEDALRQAARSSVQSFDYAAFARDSQQVRATHAATVTGCAGAEPDSARFAACAVLRTNLAGVGGLEETAEQTAERVVWTFLPSGGTCTFPNDQPAQTFANAAVCATLQPRMTGLIGLGIWTPQIDAAETLDHLGR